MAAVHQQGVVRVPLPFPGGGGGVAHRRRMPNQCSLPRRDAMRRGGNPRKSICARGRRGFFFFCRYNKTEQAFCGREECHVMGELFHLANHVARRLISNTSPS